jgi:hypothetical protein
VYLITGGNHESVFCSWHCWVDDSFSRINICFGIYLRGPQHQRSFGLGQPHLPWQSSGGCDALVQEATFVISPTVGKDHSWGSGVDANACIDVVKFVCTQLPAGWLIPPPYDFRMNAPEPLKGTAINRKPTKLNFSAGSLHP